MLISTTLESQMHTKQIQLRQITTGLATMCVVMRRHDAQHIAASEDKHPHPPLCCVAWAEQWAGKLHQHCNKV
jgi:hypothetical protein